MMPSAEEESDLVGGPQSPPARPVATRSLMAAADPARRLQELLREQAASEEAGPIAAVPPPEPPPPVIPPLAVPTLVPTPTAEAVRLSIMLDGARLAQTEYANREALPTRAELEQTHRAYIFRDQWSKSDTTPTWTVHMKRKMR